MVFLALIKKDILKLHSKKQREKQTSREEGEEDGDKGEEGGEEGKEEGEEEEEPPTRFFNSPFCSSQKEKPKKERK